MLALTSAHAAIIPVGEVIPPLGPAAPLTIGNAAVGSLTVDGGSVLNPATPVLGGFGNIALGELVTGQGTLLVDGVGSTVTTSYALITGVRGTGTTQISNGGVVTAESATIGSLNGGNGRMTVSGGGSALNLVSGATVIFSRAALNVGREQTGRLDILAGGKVTIDPAPIGNTLAGINIGGGAGTPSPGGSFANGVGTVNIDGAGSELRLKQNFVRAIVGRQGTATLNITNGGKFTVEGTDPLNAFSIVGLDPTGNGTVSITGMGSEWQAGGRLFIGSSTGGKGVVNVGQGGTLRVADTITTRPPGTLTGGGGTVIGNVVNEGTIAPGSSPGVMNVLGNITLTPSGTVELEIGGGSTGQFDQLNAFDNPATTATEGNLTLGGTIEVVLFGGFSPLLGSFFDVFTAIDITELVPVFDFPGLGSGLAWNRSIVATADGRDALRLTVVAQVPEPGVLCLLGLAFAALAFTRARQVR